MNIIKHFVWMYGLMDGWMDGWTDQSKVPLRVSLFVVQLETWHHTHRKIALSIFVYNSSHSPSFCCRWHNLSVLHHHHSSSLSPLGSGAQPDGLQAVVMRDVQLSGELSPSHSTTISNSCIISSTVYLSFEAIIAQALVFVCIRCINCNAIIIL